MVFPQLPTDSLYKFLFIAGVFLMAFTLYQVNNIVERKTLTINKYDSVVVAIHKIDSAIKYTDWVADVVSDELSPKLTKSEYSKRYTQLENNSKEQQRLRYERNDTDRKRQQIINDLDFNKRFLIGTIMFGVVGNLLFIIGAFWWWKYQNKQDRILDLQLEIMELDYQAKLNQAKEDPTKYRKR